MRIYRQFYRVSSRKFHEIVTEKQERLIPTTPEEYIISKHLRSQSTFSQKNSNLTYQQILQQYPHGSIITKQYKNVQLNLVSLNFNNTKLKDIYKLCQKNQPDLVFVQGKPEYYLPQFELLPKKKEVFSDRLFLEQLMPQNEQIQSFILSNDLKQYFESLLKGKNQSEQAKIFVQNTRGLVEDEVTLMGAFYAFQQKKKLLLGQIPEQSSREWLCNSHTLMQLQELFKLTCKNYPFYESFSLSLQKVACILKPQTFLNLRDRYMATLIQMLAAQGKYKKIMTFMGTMQNHSVWQLLSNNLLLRPSSHSESLQFTPIIEYLIGPPIKSSIIRNIQGWQIIEKHIILDVMKYGQQIIEVPMEELTTTNKIIEHYGILHNSYKSENILKFRFDKTLEYLNLMKDQIEQGRQLRKKLLLREAVRNHEHLED